MYNHNKLKEKRIIAKKIIESGFHVLVEKPLSLNCKDANRLIELSKKYKVNLMVGHVLLFVKFNCIMGNYIIYKPQLVA